MSEVALPVPDSGKTEVGMRKNGTLTSLYCCVLSSCTKLIRTGKNWRTPKKPFRPTAGLKSYEKRLQDRNNMAAMKEREKEMKDEKEAERQVVLSVRWHGTQLC
jgi:rRNA-processing protein CGR1